MSLKLWMSNSLEALVSRLHFEKRDPMQSRVVVAQTDGLRHWLSLELTKRDGVFANVEFFKPNDLVVYSGQLMGLKETEDYSVENLQWHIFLILDDLTFKKEFPNISSYYFKDDLKRIQLATKLADLFDQYIIYRTDMMIEWSKDVFNGEEQKWQKWLWNKLKQRISDSSIDKASFKDLFIEKLNDPVFQAKLKNRLPEVHLFGLSILTKYHLEMILALSKVIDVRFYFLNPCPEEYWYDCLSEKEIARKWAQHTDRDYIEEYAKGNELLLSWGKVGREMFSELLELDDDFINNTEVLFADKSKKSLLGKIQQDIHQNAVKGQGSRFSSEDLHDASLTISSCYTEVREVEVFYDYLLDYLKSRGGEAQAQDIVVMVPDIKRYAPYIRAVMDNAPRRLPYTIADEPLGQSSSVVSLLLEILSLTEADLKPESVLKLIQHQQVRTKYGILDVRVLRQALLKCNVRYGITGNQSNETHLISWLNGLKRIVFGVCMRDEVFDDGNSTVFPYELAEGSAVEDLLRFVNFCEDLIAFVRKSYKKHLISDWIKVVHELMRAFVEETNDNEQEFILLRKKLNSLLDIDTKFKQIELTKDVLLYVLKDFQANEVLNEGYFRGRITFCTALPMRSIPFDLVCFLGLNAETFPRTNTAQAFDLIQNGIRKRGDRNIKDNDRYLFLEALMSANDRLYLSYLGRNVKNNKLKTPSILIEELLAYIENSLEHKQDVREVLLTEYPLHAYSSQYFKSETGLSTYYRRDFELTDDVEQTLPAPSEEIKELDLEDLIKFFVSPSKWFIQRNTGVSYFDNESLVPDHECFEIETGLDQYLLNNAMLHLQADELVAYTEQAKINGQIPLGSVGETLVVENWNEVILPFKHNYEAVIGGQSSRTIAIEQNIDGVEIKGEIELYGNTLVDVSFSKPSGDGKRLIPQYLKLLLLRLAGFEVSSCLCRMDGVLKMNVNAMSQQEAEEQLTQWIRWFKTHQNQLLPFDAKLSYKILDQKELAYAKSLHGDSYNQGPFDYDAYLKTTQEMFGVWSDYETVKDWAEKLYEPIKSLIDG